MKQKVTIEIICSLLILLFVYAAASKLLNYSLFLSQLKESQFLSPFASIIAWFIPTIELTISLMLTAMVTRTIGLFASFILLFLFTLYIAVMLLSGNHLPCTCGGVIQSLNWKGHLAFNLFFMALPIAGIVLEKKQLTSETQKKIETFS